MVRQLRLRELSFHTHSALLRAGFDVESSTSAIVDSRFRENDNAEKQSLRGTTHSASLVESREVNNLESQIWDTKSHTALLC